MAIDDLPATPATAILDPLTRAQRATGEHLRKRLSWRSSLNSYGGTMQALTVAAEQTFRAALFLVADSRLAEQAEGKGPGPFIGQSIVLQRTLLEAVGNVMALSEDPKPRDALFRRDGYRERLRRLGDLKARYGGVDRWREALKRE